MTPKPRDLPASDQIVFLLDVDSTLIESDRFAADLSARLEEGFGEAGRRRYWTLYSQRRERLGYADYLGALQDFRTVIDDSPALLHLSGFMLDYPFAERLYPQALAAIAHLATMGTPVLVSDGDMVLQPRKIQRTGLWNAVEGRVMICLHKDLQIDRILQRFPAAHYVMVDDKPLLLAAFKRQLGKRLTTVFVRQGHYAMESELLVIAPAPDIHIRQIGDLCGLAFRDGTAQTLFASAAHPPAPQKTAVPERVPA